MDKVELEGLFCFGVLSLQPEFGLPPEPGWVIAGLIAVLLPAVHVVWQFRLVAERSKLIEQSRIEDMRIEDRGSKLEDRESTIDDR